VTDVGPVPGGSPGPGGRRRRGEMPLTEHLREFRTRLVRAAGAVLLGTVVGYLLFPQAVDLLLRPYCAAIEAADGCDLIVLGPLDPFIVRLRTAFVAGVVVGGPVLLYQLWRFITPGLTRRERRYALPFVLLSQVMFAAGIVFATWVIPRGLNILLALGGDSIRPLLGAREYLSFLLAMGLAFGLVFELPLVLVFLALAGVVTSDGMRRFRRYAIVINVVAAAIITPTVDAVSLALVAGPMILFYELAIVLAWLIERMRRRRSR
jgi:sec-independent protein translocase protein TatC